MRSKATLATTAMAWRRVAKRLCSEVVRAIAVSAFLITAGALVHRQTLAAPAPTYRYEPSVVTLQGTFASLQGETPNGRVIQFPALVLDQPINVQGDGNYEAEASVTRLHLVLSDKLMPVFSKLKGTRVSVTGTLFHSDNGNHQTKVLMTATQIAPAPGKSDNPPAAMRPESPSVVGTWDCVNSNGRASRQSFGADQSYRIQVTDAFYGKVRMEGVFSLPPGQLETSIRLRKLESPSESLMKTNPGIVQALMAGERVPRPGWNLYRIQFTEPGQLRLEGIKTMNGETGEESPFKWVENCKRAN